MTDTRELTLGGERVRLKFNPSGNPHVDGIKRMTADLIDECEDLKVSGNGEQRRLAALAATAYEEAAMWAVKAATTRAPDAPPPDDPPPVPQSGD